MGNTFRQSCTWAKGQSQPPFLHHGSLAKHQVFSDFEWSHLPNCLCLGSSKSQPRNKNLGTSNLPGRQFQEILWGSKEGREGKAPIQGIHEEDNAVSNGGSVPGGSLGDCLQHTLQSCPFQQRKPRHFFINLHLSLVGAAPGSIHSPALSAWPSGSQARPMIRHHPQEERNSGVWSRKPSTCTGRVYSRYRWLLLWASGMWHHMLSLLITEWFDCERLDASMCNLRPWKQQQMLLLEQNFRKTRT